MGTVVALARCSHLAPTVAVTAFTTLLTFGAGAGPRGGWVAAAVLAGQLSVGWSNDWLDRHRDRAAGRRDKPLVRGDVADVTVARGAVVAAVAAVALSTSLGWRAALVHTCAITLAWSYNLGLKSTTVSVVPYAGAFGLLPAFATLALQPPVWPPAWAVAAGALLGAGAHFANVLPDFETDAATGIRGLPHRMGAAASVVVSALLLAAGAVVVALGPRGEPSAGQVAASVASLVLVAGVMVAGLTDRTRVAFPLALAIAGTVVASFLAAGSQLAA